MKISKKVLSVFLVVSIIIGTPVLSFASNETLEVEYEEFHDQINFEDLSVCVVNKNDLIVEVDPTTSIFKKSEAKKQKEKYDKFIDKHPDATEKLKASVNSSEFVCAISYTDAPVINMGDHYERVIKEKNNNTLFGINAIAANSNESEPSRHGNDNFSLYTVIVKLGTKNPYIYRASTVGKWNTSISLGGSANKPSPGNDFVLQACPTVTSASRFVSTYNYKTSGSVSGQEGINFFLTDGDDSWVQYEVVDDPLGLAQLKNFTCEQTFKAKSTTKTKKINSYYIHTWEEMTISVTASGSVGVEGDTPSAGVSLSYTPGIQNKQWRVYNFVTFNW